MAAQSNSSQPGDERANMRRPMRNRILLLASASLATLWLAPAAHAGESELDEAPAPASADDVRSALKRASSYSSSARGTSRGTSRRSSFRGK